jgi:hypothetical protein
MSEGLFLFGGGGDPWAATTTLDPGRSLAEKLRFGLTGNPHVTDASKAIGQGVSQGIGAFASPFSASKSSSRSSPAAPAAAAPQMNTEAALTALNAAPGGKQKQPPGKSQIYGPFGPG